MFGCCVYFMSCAAVAILRMMKCGPFVFSLRPRESRASPSPELSCFTPSLVVVASLVTFSVKESHRPYKLWINKNILRMAERAGWHRNEMETEGKKKNMSESGGHLHQSDEALRANGSHAATLTAEG